jgi:hypothetical protein
MEVSTSLFVMLLLAQLARALSCRLLPIIRLARVALVVAFFLHGTHQEVDICRLPVEILNLYPCTRRLVNHHTARSSQIQSVQVKEMVG